MYHTTATTTTTRIIDRNLNLKQQHYLITTNTNTTSKSNPRKNKKKQQHLQQLIVSTLGFIIIHSCYNNISTNRSHYYPCVIAFSISATTTTTTYHHHNRIFHPTSLTPPFLNSRYSKHLPLSHQRLLLLVVLAAEPATPIMFSSSSQTNDTNNNNTTTNNSSTNNNNNNDMIIPKSISSYDNFFINDTELLETLTTTANTYAAAHGIQIEVRHPIVPNNNNNVLLPTISSSSPATTTTTTGVTTTTKDMVTTTTGTTTTTTTNDANNPNKYMKYYQMAPISLLPQIYSSSLFHHGQVLSTYYNTLVEYISHDITFFIQTLGGIVSQQDPYTGKLLQLYCKIYDPHHIYNNQTTTTTTALIQQQESTVTTTTTTTDRNQNNTSLSLSLLHIAQHADRLGILRSDYMLHRSSTSTSTSSTSQKEQPYHIKQVELNTISSSFAGLSYHVTKLHQYLIQRYTSASTSSTSTTPRTTGSNNDVKSTIDTTTKNDINNNNNNILDQFIYNNQQSIVQQQQQSGGGDPKEITSSSSTTTTMNGDIDTIKTTTSKSASTSTTTTGVPDNPTLQSIPYVMNLVVQRYQERYYSKTMIPTSSTTILPKIGILFVVQSNETNTIDQRMIEFQLWDHYQIPVIRLSLSQIYHQIERDDTTGALYVPYNNNNNHHRNNYDNSSSSSIDLRTGSSSIDTKRNMMEIALVYYRAGYTPNDYPSGYDGIEWMAREILECSRATKCPNLGYHLAGTKKVQQAISRPGILEQFFPNESNPMMIQMMRNAFAGLYSLDPNDMNDTDYMAIYDIIINKNYHQYVLKPQREGGGYNFYGEELYQKIYSNVTINYDTIHDTSIPISQRINISDILGEYILMERLFPPQQNAILLRKGIIEGIGLSISELGCFGAIFVAGDHDTSHNSNSTTVVTNTDNAITTTTTALVNSNTTYPHYPILHNEYAGYLLRTKFNNVDEGGVASGFATLSSPYLV